MVLVLRFLRAHCSCDPCQCLALAWEHRRVDQVRVRDFVGPKIPASRRYPGNRVKDCCERQRSILLLLQLRKAVGTILIAQGAPRRLSILSKKRARERATTTATHNQTKRWQSAISSPNSGTPLSAANVFPRSSAIVPVQEAPGPGGRTERSRSPAPPRDRAGSSGVRRYGFAVLCAQRETIKSRYPVPLAGAFPAGAARPLVRPRALLRNHARH